MFPTWRSGSSVDPGWLGGRSPATRDRLREWNVPHTAPLCNTNIVIRPTSLECGHLANPESRRFAGRSLAGRVRARGARTCTTGCSPSRLHDDLAGYRPRTYPSWGRVGDTRHALRSARGRTRRPCSVPPRSPRSRSSRLARGRLRRRRRVRRRRPGERRPGRCAALRRGRRSSREGDLRDDALDAAGKVLQHRRPVGQDLASSSTRRCRGGDANLDYEKDIKPWLGERAALWLGTRLDGDGIPSGAAIIDDHRRRTRSGRHPQGRKDERRQARPNARTRAPTTRSTRTATRSASWTEELPDRRPGGRVQGADRRAEGRQVAGRLRPLPQGIDTLDDDRLGHFYLDFSTL